MAGGGHGLDTGGDLAACLQREMHGYGRLGAQRRQEALREPLEAAGAHRLVLHLPAAVRRALAVTEAQRDARAEGVGDLAGGGYVVEVVVCEQDVGDGGVASHLAGLLHDGRRVEVEACVHQHERAVRRPREVDVAPAGALQPPHTLDYLDRHGSPLVLRLVVPRLLLADLAVSR